jgi:hypothetical protein
MATYEDIITLRRARLDDVPLLTRLMEQSIRVLQAPDYSPAQIESGLRFIYGIDTLLIEDGTYFIAQNDGEVVGCGGWSRRRMLYGGNQRRDSGDGSDTEVLDPATDAARIRAFFVRPDSPPTRDCPCMPPAATRSRNRSRRFCRMAFRCPAIA